MKKVPFFVTTEEELRARAEESLQAIERGETRSITEFKKEVTTWKQNQAI